ncbi:SGNH/GDSL hydrolase family protein [Leifsonia sp. TF02-11]|uniref:SGNH/GDSL hydrolase family protein n=1 Tax=Leifsonia sp. TF02-11 TaxID=2815212 RepID=UPI001AA0D6BD|nr:SGNH/GDSL hydrolase family protein [Leifsonia sp. TF02-11]MBO1738452.1 SGNH/GDSL hydrolase family protein [Leifsonia sp. TF02-11]
MVFTSFIAIGDSFTEGVGDDLPDGRQRGWADFVALGLAQAATEPVRYANLAIRGRKLAPILTEQLDPAIAQHPQLISLNGGGNDIMRPRVTIESVARQLIDAADRVVASGSRMLLLSGANPSRHLPMGGLLRKRGDELAVAVRDLLPRDGVLFVDNWADESLEDLRYWSADRLHLNALGHARVASNVLTALDVPVPAEWGVDDVEAAPGGEASRRTADYYRRYVLPWIGRRLTGRSSGDGRTAKIAELTIVDPASAQPL